MTFAKENPSITLRLKAPTSQIFFINPVKEQALNKTAKQG